MTTTLHTMLGYRDAPAAIDWLGSVLGFELVTSYPDEQGGVMHAELRVGDAAITLFTDRDGYQRAPVKGRTSGQSVYLVVDDEAAVAAVHKRALEHDARVLWGPVTTDWGNHLVRILDSEGFEWTVGTYRPGEPPQAWG